MSNSSLLMVILLALPVLTGLNQNVQQDIRIFQGNTIKIKEQNITLTICFDSKTAFFDIYMPQKDGFIQKRTLKATPSQCDIFNIVTTSDQITISKNLEIMEVVPVDSSVEEFVVKSASNATEYKIPTVCSTGNQHHLCKIGCPHNWCRECSGTDCIKSSFGSEFGWFIKNRLPLLFIIPGAAIMIMLPIYRRFRN